MGGGVYLLGNCETLSWRVALALASHKLRGDTFEFFVADHGGACCDSRSWVDGVDDAGHILEKLLPIPSIVKLEVFKVVLYLLHYLMLRIYLIIQRRWVLLLGTGVGDQAVRALVTSGFLAKVIFY